MKLKNSLWKLAKAAKQIWTDICYSVNMTLIPIAVFCYKRNACFPEAVIPPIQHRLPEVN